MFPTVERSRTTGDKGYGHTGRRHRGAWTTNPDSASGLVKPNKKDSMMKQYDDIIIASSVKTEEALLQELGCRTGSTYRHKVAMIDADTNKIAEHLLYQHRMLTA